MKVAQSYPTLRPHGLNSPWDSPGQNTRVGCLSLLQGIFPAQVSNPGLPHCRRILCPLSHQGSPREVKTNFIQEVPPLICVRTITMGERSTWNIHGLVGIYIQAAESGLVDGKHYEEILRVTVCSGSTNLMRRC